MAKRLVDAGFDEKDVEIVEPARLKGNLVARYRGSGELKPILLLAHIDVVEAKKEDWSDGLDPFKLTERDGYYYGRGTIDDKAMAAIFVANAIRYRREGFRPKRDLIIALTADEEGGTHNGAAWMLRNHPEPLRAEFGLNEGGSGQYRNGRPYLHGVQVSEKVPQNFTLEAVNPGGAHAPRAAAIPHADELRDAPERGEARGGHGIPLPLGAGAGLWRISVTSAQELEDSGAESSLPARTRSIIRFTAEFACVGTNSIS